LVQLHLNFLLNNTDLFHDPTALL